MVIGLVTLSPSASRHSNAVSAGSSAVAVSTPLEATLGLAERVAGAVLELPVVKETNAVLVPHLVGLASPPALSARGVLVRDRHSGKVFLEKHPDKKLPIASLTKLMTAIVVHKSLAAEELVQITEADAQVPSYRAGLAAGENYTVQDLLTAMLVSSANDATMALARHVSGNIDEFVRIMNEEARLLGMTNTSFTNPVGFDDSQHFSTAEDISRLVEEFLNYPKLTEIVKKKNAIIASKNGPSRHALATTNKLLLSNDKVIGLKTGFTAEAKGNLILLVDMGQGPIPAQFYSIILGSDFREEESTSILNWITENFQWQK